MKRDERYNIVLCCANVIFDVKVPSDVMDRIVAEIADKIEGVEVTASEYKEIEVATKFGELAFWSHALPVIDRIVKKYLGRPTTKTSEYFSVGLQRDLLFLKRLLFFK